MSSNSLTTTDELKSLETELGLMRDKLGTDQKLTDVPLRSAWEGIRFIHHMIQNLVLRTVPLLQRKDMVITSSQMKCWIASSEASITPSSHHLLDRIEELEQLCISKFVKSDKLFALCSGGYKHPAGQALSSYLRHLVTRIEKLEYGNSGGGLGSVVPSLLPSASSLQLDGVEASIALIKRDVTDLSHRIGQEVVDLGGE